MPGVEPAQVCVKMHAKMQRQKNKNDIGNYRHTCSIVKLRKTLI